MTVGYNMTQLAMNGFADKWLAQGYIEEWRQRTGNTEISSLGRIRDKETKEIRIMAGQVRKLGDIIVCNETNVIFISQAHAARWMNLSLLSVNRIINGKQKLTKGFSFTKITNIVWD